ncbi:MAG: restriction endonuclease subunit S [FCB group bacterium]|jgi:type I restriction enzyme S subunit|nr:restriction endonuclease subunit S [FCB group bacterium]
MNKNYLLPASGQVGRTSEGASHRGALHFPKCDAPGGLLRPYPAYKDSGVPWLGEIPAHWELRKTKYLFRERSEKGFPDEPHLAATQTKGVVRTEDYENRTVLALKDLHLLKLVRIGDFVISLRSFQGGIEIARHQGIISPAYTILYPINPEYQPFFGALFKSAPYIQNLSLYVTGIRQGQNIDYQKLSNSILPVPPPAEQRAIAAFLDTHDRLTRHYIHAQQRLIKLLTEQKQALIQQAVTRGLDPNVPLKDSGIEWLGKIPAHWETLRAKYVFREIDDRSATGSETLLSMSQKLGLVPSYRIEERRLLSVSYAGAKLCQKDDLVLNRLKAHLGVFALASEPGIVSPDYTVLRAARPICPRYFELILRTPACRTELCKRVKGIVQGFWRLYTEEFYGIVLPFPPLEEQWKIVEHLDIQLQSLNETITRIQSQIVLVREYRTRLIADVVTGKLDVRGFEVGRTSESASHPEDAAWENLEDEETGDALDDLDVDADGE